MKKQLLIPILLTFCSYQANAQVQVNSGSTAPANSYMLTNANSSTGTETVIIGKDAGNVNTGANNTFVGYLSGRYNTSGHANAFFGMWSGTSNVDGIANTFLGMWCGPNNTSGSHNTIVGQGAGGNNTIGGDNTFIGQGTGLDNVSGSMNTFLGKGAGNKITGSLGGNLTGTYNTAIGFYATFKYDYLDHATAIGAGAVARANNTMILGGEAGSSSAVNVGIGFGATNAPSAHLHTYNVNPEDVKFQTNSYASNSASTLELKAPYNSLKLAANNTTNTGTLPLFGAAPAVSLANSATMLTDGTTMVIGRNSLPNESSASMHFITPVAGSVTECLRINKDNGFVGVHTRSAPSAGVTGAPQAIFHVNLLNPADVSTDNDPYRRIHGIRFEGLPTSEARHTDAVLIDPTTGDLARATYTGGPGNDWHTNGNTTTGTEFIGTLAGSGPGGTGDDFRIRTDGNPVARFTWNGGNFILGPNFPASTSYTTAVVGSANLPDDATSSILVGKDNDVKTSFYSATIGDDNNIEDANASQATGKQNNIVSSNYALAAGENNSITNTSNNSQAMGQLNIIDQSAGSFAAGSSNEIKSVSDKSIALGTSNEIDASNAAMAAGSDNEIKTSSNASIALGNHNKIIGASSTSMAAGDFNEISVGSTNSMALGKNNVITDISLTAIALGEQNIIRNTEESVVAGEWNTMVDGHGSFIGGGHNTAVGDYNFIGGDRNQSDAVRSIILGNNMKAETTATAMPTVVDCGPSIMLMGNQINSDLHNSLTVGFNANRTTVTTDRGLAVQLDPQGTTTVGTYVPNVNFEVEASVTPIAPLAAILPAALRSNIRFHHLPAADAEYPAVLVDPSTGELFMSNLSYKKEGNNSSDDITKLQKENEDLKNRLSQLESMLSKYDDKFAQLEKSIYQICETGCAGLNTHLSDDLYQSIPNPSSTEANIGYYLANNYSNASIQLINIEGKVVRTFNLNPSRGNGSINVPLSELQPGVYLYKLVVDGKQIGAKKLQKQ